MLPKIVINTQPTNRRFPPVNLDCYPFTVEQLIGSLIYVKNSHALEFYFAHRGFLFRISIDQNSFRSPPIKKINSFTLYGDKFSNNYTQVNVDGIPRPSDFDLMKTVVVNACDAMIVAAIHES